MGRDGITALRLVLVRGSAAPADCASGEVIDLAVEQTTYIVSGLEKGVSYGFRLCAEVSGVSSGWSDGKAVTVTTSGNPPPPEVTNLEAIATSDTQIALSWISGGAEAKGFRIAYRAGSQAPESCSVGTRLTENEITGTSREVSGLLPETSYGFRVCSVAAGAGDDIG